MAWKFDRAPRSQNDECFTEHVGRFQRIQTEAQTGQYTMKELRKLRDDELVYLDGHQEPVDDPNLTPEKRHKLSANARRARGELDRRLQLRALIAAAGIGVLGAIAGGVVGGVIGARAQHTPQVIVQQPTRTP
jgi:hypothetical protein